MKVGVTGAGGYVGAGLCGKLMERGHEVVMVDNFYNAQVKDVHGNKIVWADIRDREEMEKMFADCDLIIHLAAISGVAECDDMPDKAYEVNVVGTANIAWMCRKYGIDLIFPSSMAVIGDPIELPIKSTHPRNPLNIYGLTKWVDEEIIRTLSKGKFNALVFMKTNIYGEYELDGRGITKRTVINIFVNKALKGETLTVHKPGTQTRDFIHVLDVIDAYVMAVENLPKGFNISTLAGGECLSVLDIAKLVRKYSNVEIELIENPRKGETHAKNFEVDTEEAKHLIGFEAKRRVEEEIKRQLGR
ncbi:MULTISPECIES: NAD-dependent epimerase/dehydratase family protein [unclassified Archaeoglobus]|jgi:UDP-glucose 4-epimerase|uniref:NAD-dependent epimerase/dehydratase family protein n=1 Tax=unclassified Archaeoglobus TaxID=2643606 RepID=UPI0025C1B335|nr:MULTISPECIES: NAD-dependent epimerase/dehydratase family protein [unclassified Archaeoglobus]